MHLPHVLPVIVLNRYNDSSTYNKETKRRRKNAIANRENIFPEVAWLEWIFVSRFVEKSLY